LVVDLAVNPFLDPLRENTDFKQIIARLRFPAVERGRSGRPNG
jgi:hypothetical protein